MDSMLPSMSAEALWIAERRRRRAVATVTSAVAEGIAQQFEGLPAAPSLKLEYSHFLLMGSVSHIALMAGR